MYNLINSNNIIAVVELGTLAKSTMGDIEKTKINVPLGAVIEC